VKKQKKGKALVCALLVTGLGGCQFVSGLFGDSHAGPGSVNDVVGTIEQVYIQSELSKERMQLALAELQAISRAEFSPDAATAYARLVKSVEDSEQQAERLHMTYRQMKDAAEPFFEAWTDKLQEYTNASMRLRSQSRLAATRQRYEAIVAAVEPGLVDYQEVNKGMRDYTLFLGHDLNPSSLAEIREGVRALSARAGMAERGFDACLVAARSYVDTSALPVTDQDRQTAEELGERPAAPDVREVSATDKR
jgi:hypothetical protein